MIKASDNPLNIAKYIIPTNKIIVVAIKHEIKLYIEFIVYPFLFNPNGQNIFGVVTYIIGLLL